MKLKSDISSRSAMSDPAIVKEICNNLKQIRLNKNLSQAELAKKAGLNRVTISRMEAGRAATLLTLVQVLRALDKLDILDMVKEEAEVSPLQLLKQHEKQRQRASGPRGKSGNQEEEPEW